MVYNQATDSNYLTSLLALSSPQFLKNLGDNYFNKRALLFLLKDNSQVTMMDGGTYIEVPLMVDGDSKGGSYDGYDKLNIAPKKGFVTAEVPWAHYYEPITLAHTEIQRNSNDGKVLDIMAARMTQSQNGLENNVNKGLFSDGTGNGGKDIVGIKAMCEASATPTTTYMGITSSTVAAWVNQYQGIAGTVMIAGLRDLFYSQTDGDDAPDIILTNGTGFSLYEKYNLTSGATIAYTNNKLADNGFITLSFKGIPMTLDASCPITSGTVTQYYMLNSKYIGFKWGAMSTTPFSRVPDQMAEVSIISADCQLVTNNRRRQGLAVITTS